MKRCAALILALALTLCAGGCAAQAPLRSVVGFYLDTVISIKAYADNAALLDQALGLCGEYEKIFSKTIEGSDVWRINHAGGQKTQVHPAVTQVLKLSQQVAQLSGGAFDVTIAPATALWDFKADPPALPDAEALAQAAAKVDYTKLVIEDDFVTLPQGMQIDLGGVAKGYIADLVAQYLREQGVESALLDFGGNVVSIGEKPDGAGPWVVGVQNPTQPRGDSLLAVKAKDLCVVTSGTYERGFDLDGVRYHHLLDPKTGWPAQNELLSATIFAGSSAQADALSTAAFVLGVEKGAALIEQLPGIEALFITKDGQILGTSGAQNLLAQ